MILKRLIIGLVFFSLWACSKEEEIIVPSFFSELRPQFYERLNFDSTEIVAQLPLFLDDFKTTYDRREEEFEDGLFISEPDLNNMGLSSMYYSFLITGVVKGYLDGFLTFEDIKGDRENNFFSEMDSVNAEVFEKKELQAMIDRAVEVAELGMTINGFNDRLQGAYLAAMQVQGRLNNNGFNDATVQDTMIGYVQTSIKDYTFFPSWNVLISLVFMENYEDELNTFRNPKMNIVLNHTINRLDPSVLPNLTTNYNSLLAPMYHFDLVMKKTDWLIHKSDTLSQEEVQELGAYITRLETLESSIAIDREALLNTWKHKDTFKQRQDKLTSIKTFFSRTTSGRRAPKPQLTPFFNSKDFKQAYQCYSCHESPNL